MAATIRRRADFKTAIVLLVIAVLAAEASSCRAPETRRPDRVAPAEVVDPWTPRGLEHQPEMEALRERVRPDDAVKPASTTWDPVAEPLPTLRADTPGELLVALLHERKWGAVLGNAAWETTLRVLPNGEDTALGIVLQWGFMDDAVAGRDYRVLMRRAVGGWSLQRIDQRFHCRRAVGTDQRCK